MTTETSDGSHGAGQDQARRGVSAAPHHTGRTTLHPIQNGRVAERVVAEIRSYITDNDLRPGHKLPPERVFIEQLAVGRSSLREALRVLTTIGLIEVRHGDGMYVSAAPEAWVSSSAAIFDATEENALRNLVETRLGVELAATLAAISRASDEDLDQLERDLDAEARRCLSDAHYEWEPLGFELALVEMSGNGWLYDIEIMLRDAWRELSGGLRSSVGRHREWLSEHRAILASVRSRNVTQAQRLIIAHLNLERFESDLQARTKTKARTRR
jgi:GntR family transcriptional repressor for pyruvate dehydrogenase complex